MQHNIKAAYIFIITSALFIFTACSGQEVNQRAFVQLMGIEKNGDNYVVNMQMYTPMSSSGSPDISQTNSSSVSGSGATVYEAISNAEVTAGKSMFLGHIKLMILGRGIDDPAKELSAFLDGTVSPACPVVYSYDVKSVIDTEISEGLFTADNMLKTMDAYVRSGKCMYTTIAGIEENIACLNAAAPLPLISSEGDSVNFNGAILAHSGGIGGRISADDMFGVKLMCGDVKSGDKILVPVQVGDKSAAAEILKADITKKAAEENGKLKITADVCIKINIAENKDNLSEKQISEAVCRSVRDSCISAFSTAVWSEERDIFGISKLIRRDCPDLKYSEDTLRNSVLFINVKSECEN
ncbi:MAG: Ger(x)C family spore germination C-terminal domain-containing protein [Oscillospiraceae bacterium]